VRGERSHRVLRERWAIRCGTAVLPVTFRAMSLLLPRPRGATRTSLQFGILTPLFHPVEE